MLFIVGVIVAAVSLSAQSPRPAVGKWTAARTPDGHPDLQGIWTTHTFTPLVRPARYALQEFLTDEEAAESMAGLSRLKKGSLTKGREHRMGHGTKALHPQRCDQLEQLAEKWRPLRAVAARMLWQFYLARRKV